MILFRDSELEDFWKSNGEIISRRFRSYANVLMRKLRMLEAARELYDLRVPPGNRLEALHGNREGCFSIQINDQYRICFIWAQDGPLDVEVTDYH